MADKAKQGNGEPDPDMLEEDTNYRPPAQKALEEILNTDKEDESLQKYKAALLGSAAGGQGIIVKPEDPRKVLVQSLQLVVDGRPDVTLDLTDINNVKGTKFVMKEGVHYRLRINFYVQREIVAGLKYVQKVQRMNVPLEKTTHMVGSYPPAATMHSFQTPLEEAPSGMMARGSYSIKSLFTDDDKNEHLKWEWTLEIKKDW
ncbi:rho GDP-dissociation inhibitor 1-like [Paramacrobiotus metropolitanus]|uniref:rho GDP-dissociation inhibitor 1-like n=1 Tax=Paramacrobiotus metropolitanus TaxID=2943436 RepID=UPI002445B63E|nr:rho GDP-dissociation inhibitor 1-like [Paramacrobiotus metropolitanus]